jgi:hypothetical protein
MFGMAASELLEFVAPAGNREDRGRAVRKRSEEDFDKEGPNSA